MSKSDWGRALKSAEASLEREYDRAMGHEVEYEPVETMQTTLPDGSKARRIVLDKDGAGMNIFMLTTYSGGEHDGRIYVELCSDAEHQNGTLLHQLLTREQTTALRNWLNEK